MLALREIGRPGHQHNVPTRAAYAARQAAFIQAGRVRYPRLTWRDPVTVDDPIPAVISGGFWIVHCPCGNGPAADPEWRLACCFECGAMYTSVVVPAAWRGIESALLERSEMATRNWLPGETVGDLQRETLAHEGSEG